MMIALCLAAALMAPQDHAHGVLPRVDVGDAALAVELADELGVTLARAPLCVEALHLGGERFTAHRPDPELWLDGKQTAPRLEEWRVDRDTVCLRVGLGQRARSSSALATFRAAEVDGLPALERRAFARRSERSGDSSVLTLESLQLLPDAPRVRALEHYGHSTVSEPGITYGLEGIQRPDGSVLWTFRSGLHLMNQALNLDHDADHLEVTVLAPPGHGPLEAALIERYVAEPRDREALLELTAPADPELDASVAELRHVVGEWAVTTEFLDANGAVAGSTEGTYAFEWAVPDRVVSGAAEQPALGRRAALLFYVSVEEREIEMVSVAGDGKLWVMTGPLGGDVRTSQTYATEDGGEAQLRFTRSEVTADRFVSSMESTRDGGRTWTPSQRQVFVRRR